MTTATQNTNTTPNITLRPADQRGVTNIGWLNSRHSFSFGQYFDPNNVSYRSLRVINDDHVAAGAGFGEHGHDNMEIITWVLDGTLKHRDSTGAEGNMSHGDLQVMTAGSGIRHSEMNGSSSEEVHFLQIWLTPDTPNVEPNYQEKHFEAADRANQWQTVAAPRSLSDAQALPIHQDAILRIADLSADSLELTVEAGRHAYVHVATGEIEVDGQRLSAGDAFTTDQAQTLTLNSSDRAQVLWFDLA